MCVWSVPIFHVSYYYQDERLRILYEFFSVPFLLEYLQERKVHASYNVKSIWISVDGGKKLGKFIEQNLYPKSSIAFFRLA